MADEQSQNPMFAGLVARGYSPIHAAALTGNMLQESGGNPAAVNPGEDAHGLLQWRQDRWQGLQDFAKTRGVAPTDFGTQLDYIGQEIGGPEAKAGSRFLAATDLPSANAALKGYIRYGDNSDTTRLNNAVGILNQGGGATTQPGAASAAAPAPASSAPGILNGGTDTPDDSAALQLAFAKATQQPQEVSAASLPPIRFAAPKGFDRAKFLAALTARKIA